VKGAIIDGSSDDPLRGNSVSFSDEQIAVAYISQTPCRPGANRVNEPSMNSFGFALPIDDVLSALTAALRARDAAVLVAPPGAGKTTRVPLVLADEPWAQGRKILVLEPRRIAARAAAERMAATLGESAGETVGYRVRFGSKV
jgi:ATP-dependent helicase HrpB